MDTARAALTAFTAAEERSDFLFRLILFIAAIISRFHELVHTLVEEQHFSRGILEYGKISK
jgi:hypothetical protein